MNGLPSKETGSGSSKVEILPNRSCLGVLWRPYFLGGGRYPGVLKHL